MFRHNTILFFAILFGVNAVLYGQVDDPIRVDSSIVRLNVGVVDSRGRSITTLDRNSFLLYEDGVKQEISKFESTDAPFSVALLLDMSGSTLTYRQVLKSSASRFIDALT